MSQSACPTPEELSRQLSLGPTELFSAHLSSCSKCAQAFEQESSLLNMFRELPWGQPPAAQISGVRSFLLQQASLPQTNSSVKARLPWIRLALAAVVLLAVGATLYLSLSNPKPPKPPELVLAKVEGTTNSQYAFEGSKDNEVVRLHDGIVTVQVTHLKPGERFRVVTGDAEVEVRGTKFSVVAKDNKLVKVIVFEGKVEVRPVIGKQTFVLPSQSWDAEKGLVLADAEKELVPVDIASTQATTLAVAPEDPKRPSKALSLPKHELKTSRSPSEEAFDAGFALMREANFEDASERFLQAATLDTSAPIVEDARFWYATALNRAGRKAQAQTALTSFVAKYPNSPRRGEAAVSLGKLLLNSGDLDGAQLMFESAQDDSVPVVQKSAKDGLEAVAKKRVVTPAP
jgi:hypothetical protein